MKLLQLYLLLRTASFVVLLWGEEISITKYLRFLLLLPYDFIYVLRIFDISVFDEYFMIMGISCLKFEFCFKLNSILMLNQFYYKCLSVTVVGDIYNYFFNNSYKNIINKKNVYWSGVPFLFPIVMYFLSWLIEGYSGTMQISFVSSFYRYISTASSTYQREIKQLDSQLWVVRTNSSH